MCVCVREKRDEKERERREMREGYLNLVSSEEQSLQVDQRIEMRQTSKSREL